MLRRGSAAAVALLVLSLSTTHASSTTAASRNISVEKMRARVEFMRAMKGAKGIGKVSETKRETREQRRRSRTSLKRKLLAKARPSPASLEGPESPFLSSHRRLDDGDDGDDDEYGFGVTDYSFRYAGCSAVGTYSGDMAEDEDADGVIVSKRFVVFRLCPTDYCSSDYPYGCGSGYGEYIVDMDDYLGVMSEFQEEQLERYCNYCEQCMGRGRCR